MKCGFNAIVPLIVIYGLGCLIPLFANEKITQKLPYIQVNDKVLPFKDALALKGVSLDTKRMEVWHAGFDSGMPKTKEDLLYIGSALFPENILVNFEFEGTIAEGKIFLNERGPYDSIQIDGNGNGKGAAYLKASGPKHVVEVKKESASVSGSFSARRDSEMIHCEGVKELNCNSSN